MKGVLRLPLLALLVLATAPLGAGAQQAVKPAPSQGCAAIAALMIQRAGATPDLRLAEARPGRRLLDGFSIEAPPGAWCEVPGWRRDRAFFVHDDFRGEALDPPPAAARLRHVLSIYAFLILNDDRTPFTGAKVLRMLDACIDGPCPSPLPRPTQRRIAGAECYVVAGSLDGPLETVDQRHVACIHPVDPRHLVKIVISEAFPIGQPFYAPRLMARSEAEIQAFLDSLRFGPIRVP